ncbi:phosphatase PAP2 family protein [Prosthecomicrobium sp. N25]|uniref:phosphatase PAP2 family protein n=1 Tax=Prosthecomicrobium sp. N25 TaxID=3129254 RepID=UPI003078673C
MSRYQFRIMNVVILSTLGFQICVFSFLLLLTSASVDFASGPHFAFVFGFLATIHIGYRTVVDRPQVRLAVQCLAAMLFTTIMGGATAIVALGLELPFIDPWLAQADRTLGYDPEALVLGLKRVPYAIPTIFFGYDKIDRALILAVVGLAGLGRSDRVRELCLIYVVTLAFACTVSIVLPAQGAFLHLPISEEMKRALPAGSGVYHLGVLDAWRSGAVRTLDLGRLPGVVTFPSFHTAMALMLAWSVRGIPWVRWPTILFAAAALGGVLPIGGHYFVDVIGGAVCFAAAAWLAREVARDRQLPPAPRNLLDSRGVSVLPR